MVLFATLEQKYCAVDENLDIMRSATRCYRVEIFKGHCRADDAVSMCRFISNRDFNLRVQLVDDTYLQLPIHPLWFRVTAERIMRFDIRAAYFADWFEMAESSSINKLPILARCSQRASRCPIIFQRGRASLICTLVFSRPCPNIHWTLLLVVALDDYKQGRDLTIIRYSSRARFNQKFDARILSVSIRDIELNRRFYVPFFQFRFFVIGGRIAFLFSIRRGCIWTSLRSKLSRRFRG